MKTKPLIILSCLLIMTTGGFAQIEEGILQSKTSKIERGRAYLLEHFFDRDYAKVTEAKDDLLSLEDDHYLAFAPLELINILLWTQEFDALKAFVQQIDSVYTAGLRNRIIPPKDALRTQVFQRTVEDEHLLRYNVDEAIITEEDKAFLTLYLDWFTKPVSYQHYGECNKKSEKFLKQYPNSPYKWFVQNVIYRELSTLNRDTWAWGMGFDLCGGYVTGKLSETMTPIVGLGLSFNLAYKKLLMELGYDIVLSKTKVNQPISTGVYKAGSHNELINFYLDVSYPAVSAKEWSISPMVGIGGCWETIINTIFSSNILSYDEIAELEHFYPTARAGLMLDIKTHGAFEDGVIRIKYHCGLSNYGGSTSSIHMISVGSAGLMNFRKKH